MALNAAKSSIPFGRIKRPPKAWWSAEVESAVSERRKAFAAPHRSDEDRQAYLFVLDAPRQSSPKPRLRHGGRLALLFHRNLTLDLYTLLFALSLTLLPRLPLLLISPTVLLPGESALVYAAYLRFHFSVFQPKALCSRAKGYLSELRRATCPVESHSSFCSPFTLAEFHAAASNLSSSTATGPDKVAYPMPKHLSRSGMGLLLHIFNLSWSSHSFPSIGRQLPLFPFTRWKSLSTLLLTSGLSLSPPAYQSCLNASYYPVYFFF